MNLNVTFEPSVILPPPPVKPAPYRILTVPDDGREYRYLLDDWDTDVWGRSPRSRVMNYKKDPPWNALPATIPTQKLFYALNKRWQLFYFELCHRAVFDTMSNEDLLSAYRRTTRDAAGWRDRHTWENVKDATKVFTDYVLGENLPPAHTYGDAAQQDLLSSGNIIRVLKSDARWVYYETLDIKLPPPDVETVWGKWWLVGWATLSAYNWDTGAKARLKWPFFDGYGAPLLFVGSDGVNKVEKYWTRPIKNGTQYSLYT